MYRPKAPQSCEECARQMEFVSDAEEGECFYRYYFKIKSGCPFQKFHEFKNLGKIFDFVMKALDSWEATIDEPTTKFSKQKPEKRKKYGLSIEKFNWACNLYQVPQEDQLEAVAWCVAAAKAANDAPEIAIKEERLRRWGRKS